MDCSHVFWFFDSHAPCGLHVTLTLNLLLAVHFVVRQKFLTIGALARKDDHLVEEEPATLCEIIWS